MSCDNGYKLLGRQQMCHDAQRCRLNREQVVVFHLRAALPHEFSQPQQILEVVTRLPPGYGDASSDLFGAGRPQIQWVVRGGDVQQRLNRWLVLPIGEEVDHLGDVAATDHLAYVEVFQGLLHLRARHLKCHAPRAGLQREVEKLTHGGHLWRTRRNGRPSTYVIVFDQRHHSSGLYREKRSDVMSGAMKRSSVA